MSKKLLVVVDYQNDFVDGALGFEKATKIAPYIISLVKKYEEEGEDVWFTKDTHFNNYLETQEGKNLPVAHCISQTKGHELYGELQSLSRNHTVIEKNTFPSLMLANLLKDTAHEEVRVIGVVTDICVISNCIMIKSALPEALIEVDTKGCASFDENLEKAALTVLEKSLQVKVI